MWDSFVACRSAMMNFGLTVHTTEALWGWSSNQHANMLKMITSALTMFTLLILQNSMPKIKKNSSFQIFLQKKCITISTWWMVLDETNPLPQSKLHSFWNDHDDDAEYKVKSTTTICNFISSSQMSGCLPPLLYMRLYIMSAFWSSTIFHYWILLQQPASVSLSL